MRVLVTGGNGFIGSHIVDKLVDMQYNVTVIDNQSAESNEEFYVNDKTENYVVDICDYEKVRPLMTDVDVVFHLAAESRIQPSILNPIHATQVNVVGTCNILQAARDAGVERVIYSSTSAGYGLKNESPLTEDMPKDCLNPYSVTKCAAEELCVMYNNLFGLKTISLRYFNVYGERQPYKGQYAPVVGIFLDQYNKNQPMTVVGDGSQRRDFVHVTDVTNANIIASLTNNEEAFGEVFNVGTGKNYSILELAKVIGGEYKYIPSRPGEAKDTLSDNTKINNILKWKPMIDFEEWIKGEINGN